MKLLRISMEKLDSADGFMIPALLGMMMVLLIVSISLTTIIDSNMGLGNTNVQRQQAFNIAEAGLNYYLWHLSHSPSDFKDGQSTPATPGTYGYGPYTHTYIDDDAKTKGTYTIYVNPQGGGSTIVNVRSTGTVAGTNISRTLTAQIGAPSYASYAVASDNALWFGSTETATGPVHSNVGVRMDGASNTDVTSANATYVPSSSLGGNGSTSQNGVWCSNSVTTPVNCATRSKVDWRYPVPTIDFNQITGSLCSMKKTAFSSDASTSALSALANACSQTPTTRTNAYLPQRSTTGTYSASKGYLINLNSNGTYDLYNVNAETDTASSYNSALTTSVVATGLAVPSSGVVFAEDNVWVRSNPTFHGKITIGAGRLAQSTVNAEIVIADDLLYSAKDGSDAIGLVGEDAVYIAPYAPPQSGAFNFEINAAIIAQSSDVVWPLYYRSSTSNCTKGFINSNQQFLFYGSIANRQTWTWTWLTGGNCGNAVYDASVNNYISGIKNNTTQYDYNLMYSPPPSFPITSSYNILSWREVLTNP